MDITKFVVSSREKTLPYGDYATYRTQLSGRLLNSRKKLKIATKNRGKYQPRAHISPEQIAANHEHVYLEILTAERAWAHAMSMKAAHSADTNGISSKTRSHIVSRLDKGARTAEKLAQAVSEVDVTGASSTEVLEARAYAAMLRGAGYFEKKSWEECLKSYAVSRIIYSAIPTAAKGDVYKELLSETIDHSIRYAAYQLKIPRTQPIATIARQAFPHDDSQLVELVSKLNADVLKQSGSDTKQNDDGIPKTLTWRRRVVKIEDAAIAVAWGSVLSAKAQLAEKIASAPSLNARSVAAAYDEILTASQDAVDATKQAIDELKAEGLTPSDSRMQSLQITRTAVNFKLISWRIGRNRVLTGRDDGAALEVGESHKRKKRREESSAGRRRDVPPGRRLARLKEKVVLYDGTLQSIESIMELPGVASDQDLYARLVATTKYFVALKCTAISRSHSIVGQALNALALMKHALDQCGEALPVLSSDDAESTSSLRDMTVTKEDVGSLHGLLSGELQRCRALVEISNLKKQASMSQGKGVSQPLAHRLSDYPTQGADLSNIVVYPPRLEAIAVKPLFLDVAFNYIGYSNERPHQAVGQATDETDAAGKPHKRGWFGFGR